MTSHAYYTIPVDSPHWQVGQDFTTRFSWEYCDGRADLLELYAKGKRKQWNANDRIDWTRELQQRLHEIRGMGAPAVA